jgi:hypothetical protein
MLSCGFEAGGANECLKVFDNAVMQAVEWRSSLVRDSAIGANEAEKTRSERGVDCFKQF